MRRPRTGKAVHAARLLLLLKYSTEIFFSFVVLLCSVFSKLSLVGLTNHLGYFSSKNGSATSREMASRTASLYWQLLIILLTPNVLTVLRCLVFGFIGKSFATFPFPNLKATIVVSSDKYYSTINN